MAETSLTPLVPDRLRCEHLLNPLGLDVRRPRLTWALQSEARDVRQRAYHILVASNPALLEADRGDLWDSGIVQSANTVLVPYEGRELESRERCHWKVMVWDARDQASPWSAPAFWEMGLLEQGDWSAQWIGLDWALSAHHAEVMMPARHLHSSFHLEGVVRRARLYATARGVYEARINGQRVGDQHFAPGWTDYQRRIQYQTYDVTSLLRFGENALGAILGDGWYAGHVGFLQVNRPNRHYGSVPQFLAQLEIEFEDGTRRTLATTGAWDVWRATMEGPILHSDFLMGEHYDARQELTGWDAPGFDDSSWRPVQSFRGGVPLVADRAEPVRELMRLEPVGVTTLPDGARIFDLGQNIVGWASLRVRGEAGSRVQLRFAEILNPDGTLYTENLRQARATDTYVLHGVGEEIYEPHFTFHGFRYVEVVGQTETLEITGVVLSSDTPFTGDFECSSEMVNRLHANIVWGQRDNFLSIPTDCPQRDERMGWLGDAQIFARTAAFNADVAAFFTKWMIDVEDAQAPSGGFPDVAPRLTDTADGAPGWGDAGVIVPWTIYLHYGDLGIVERHWQAMCAWMAYIQEANPEHRWLHRRNNDFGDWLALDGDDPANAFGSRTPKDVLATAYWAFDASLMARMARVLGRHDEALEYEALFERIRAAFQEAYLGPDGWVHGRTQTGQALALRFGLLPENLRSIATARLVDAINAKDGHLATGFLGVRDLLPALSENGRIDVAYDLLLKESFPSWLYSIRQGATTIWERWDGWTEAGGFQTPQMNSFNHYSLGSVGEWLYRSVAGIDTASDEVGFGHLVVRPKPGGNLSFARARLETVRGPIESSWSTADGAFTLRLNIPANTRASVYLPAPYLERVTEGGLTLEHVPGLRAVNLNGLELQLELGSGSYTLRAERTSTAEQPPVLMA